jgi:cephalosporin hydroxylase
VNGERTRAMVSETPRFVDENLLRVADRDFHCDFFVDDAPAGRLPVMKDRALVERYIEVAEQLRPVVIVEFGIRRGGSTALLDALCTPDKLIAVEISTNHAAALQEYIDEHALSDIVRPYYGVDQADRARLLGIVAEEIGRRPIDLVVDDASHLYPETLASFEALFPRLRPGALYVIEDWNADQLISDVIAHRLSVVSGPEREAIEQKIGALQIEHDEQARRAGSPRISLTQLAVELAVARASSGDAIREVRINGNWIVIERGADVVDPDGFRLADLVHDHFGFTTAVPRGFSQ